MVSLQKLKVELKARDLDTSGKKAELAERLESHLQAQPAAPGHQANVASTSVTAQDSSAEPVAAKVAAGLIFEAFTPSCSFC